MLVVPARTMLREVHSPVQRAMLTEDLRAKTRERAAQQKAVRAQRW